jgi:hypothetical protein
MCHVQVLHLRCLTDVRRVRVLTWQSARHVAWDRRDLLAVVQMHFRRIYLHLLSDKCLVYR